MLILIGYGTSLVAEGNHQNYQHENFHIYLDFLQHYKLDCSCRPLLHQYSNQALACQTRIVACLLINQSVGQGEQRPPHKDIGAQHQWSGLLV